MTTAHKENYPPTPKLTLTRGQFFPEAIFSLPPNPKTNLNLDQNPNRNQGGEGGQFSSGGNCPDTKWTR